MAYHMNNHDMQMQQNSSLQQHPQKVPMPNSTLSQQHTMTTQNLQTTQSQQTIQDTSAQLVVNMSQNQSLTQPAQHPYATRASNVASVSGTQTPYSFSESEDDSQFDGDQPSWQEFTNKGKKRGKSSNKGEITLKKTKRQTNDYNPSFESPNNYNLLPQEETISTEQKRKEPAPPPIFVPGIINMQPLKNLLEQVISQKDYTLKTINRDTIKIMPTNLEVHKAAVDILKKEKVEFHTYQPKQHRAYRVVLRNAHYSVDQTMLSQEIEGYGHTVRNVWNIRDKTTGRPLSIFFIDLEPADNNIKIYDITYLQNMKIQFEPPYQKRNNIPQCKRCQGYFHTKRYCEHKPRCVKCGRLHNTEECKLPRSEPPKCVHCGEGHPANYKGCKVYQDIIKSRRQLNHPLSTNNRTENNQTNNRTTTDKENRSTTQKTYAQVIRGDQITPTTTTTCVDDIPKIMEDSFRRLESILMKQAEQMNSIITLLTTVLTKLVK